MKNAINQRKAAVLSGISIILMALVAGAAMGGGLTPIFAMSEAQYALQYHALRSPLLWAAAGWVVILICDLLSSWGLYRFYADRDQRKSVIMGLLRLAYSFILMIAVIQLFRGALTGADTPKASFGFIQSFQSVWQFGLIVFGFHLITLAGLVNDKKILFKILAILLLVAGTGYTASNTADLFIENYEAIRPKAEAVFILPMVLGELGLALWLLIRGGRETNELTEQVVS